MSGQRQPVGSSPGHAHSFTDFTCSIVMTRTVDSGFIKSLPVGDFVFHRNFHIITRFLFHSDRTGKGPHLSCLGYFGLNRLSKIPSHSLCLSFKKWLVSLMHLTSEIHSCMYCNLNEKYAALQTESKRHSSLIN